MAVWQVKGFKVMEKIQCSYYLGYFLRINLFYLIVLAVLFPMNVSFARDYWGNIAIDVNTGITGSARNFPNENDAISGSLMTCKKKHKGTSTCQTGITFSNACGAVAWSPVKRVGGGGWADSSQKGAEIMALTRCKSKGAGDCKIVQSFCTSWEVNETVWW